MTGGEPLMDKNTFKVLDYIRENPNPELEISLTTNMCPPDDALFDKFMDKIKKLEEPIIPEKSNTRVEFDKSIYLKPPVEGKRKLVFYVQDPKDGSDWKTWEQKVIYETLQGVFVESMVPNTKTIKFKEIEQTFTALGPCDDEDDHSFVYAADYVLDKEYNVWEHQYENVYVKHISVFISLDSVGEQAEYIRDGLDFEKLKRNVDRLLNETQRVSVTFINTFNILSIPGLKGFLEYMLELRRKFGYQHQFDNKHRKPGQRVWFDIPYLRYPDWITIQLCDQDMLDTMQEYIDFMKQNVLSNADYGLSYHGFKNYEVLKLERDLAWAKTGDKLTEQELSDKLVRFYDYFNEYDRRRNKNFLETFPEMTDFWLEAREEREIRYGKKILGR